MVERVTFAPNKGKRTMGPKGSSMFDSDKVYEEARDYRREKQKKKADTRKEAAA